MFLLSTDVSKNKTFYRHAKCSTTHIEHTWIMPFQLMSYSHCHVKDEFEAFQHLEETWTTYSESEYINKNNNCIIILLHKLFQTYTRK